MFYISLARSESRQAQRKERTQFSLSPYNQGDIPLSSLPIYIFSFSKLAPIYTPESLLQTSHTP